jgi:hypothetical protein
LTSLSLYIFTIWKCIVYYRLCRDGIYLDKILVSEYKLFKRSNKANLFIAAGTFERNESGRFGTLKSDSSHHFFRNAWTKSGSLRFSQFSGCWLILSVYILMSLTIFLTLLLTSLSLYIFTMWKCIVYYRLCRDGIYLDKILVSEYKHIHFTEFGTALTTIIPMLFQYCYTYCYSDSRNLWAVMKAGGLAL